MNEGEDGSVAIHLEVVERVNGGWIDKPFIFLGLRGAGDVIGRSKAWDSGIQSMLFCDVAGRQPNVVDG